MRVWNNVCTYVHTYSMYTKSTVHTYIRTYSVNIITNTVLKYWLYPAQVCCVSTDWLQRALCTQSILTMQPVRWPVLIHMTCAVPHLSAHFDPPINGPHTRIQEVMYHRGQVGWTRSNALFVKQDGIEKHRLSSDCKRVARWNAC